MTTMVKSKSFHEIIGIEIKELGQNRILLHKLIGRDKGTEKKNVR